MTARWCLRASPLVLAASASGCLITRGTLDALLTREARQVQWVEAAVAGTDSSKVVGRVRFSDGKLQELEWTPGANELVYGPEGSLAIAADLPRVPAGSAKAPPAAPVWVDLERVALHHGSRRAYLGRREDRAQPGYVALGILLTPLTIVLDIAFFPVNAAAFFEPELRRVHVSKARR